jgi:CheY-like chemotaxis protein
MRHEYDPRIQHARIIWHEDPNFELFMLDLIEKTKPDRIVETGTHMGWTTAWFAEHFKGPIDTVELDPGYARLSRENLSDYGNVTCHEGSSPEFLRAFLADPAHRDELTLFWLDAHWWQYTPLQDECREVAKLARYVAVLDDFHTDNPYFEGDVFGLQTPNPIKNDIEYVGDILGWKFGRPNYSALPGFKGYGLFLRGVDYELPSSMKWEGRGEAKKEEKKMIDFEFRHVNRQEYPQKRILVCEDDLDQQGRLAAHFSRLFGPQHKVQVSFVDGGLAASAVLCYAKVDLILLDHDMPEGNGVDLLRWLRPQMTLQGIPIVTFSGIEGNNVALVREGAHHKSSKEEVLSGKADELIRKLLGLEPPASVFTGVDLMPAQEPPPRPATDSWIGSWGT